MAETVSARSAEFWPSNTSMRTSSQAENRFFRSPSRLSTFTLAIWAVAPFDWVTVLCFSLSLPLPAASISLIAPFIASSPKMTFRYSACCAVPSLLVLNEPLIFLRMFAIGSMFPLPSLVFTPNSDNASAACPTGACNRVNIALAAVPAIDPLMPLSANTPSKAVVSSILAPAASAIGATYFIASPKSIRLLFELVKPLVITSATRWISSIGMLNADCMLVMMSAASAISRSEANARLTVDSVDFRMASPLKPDFANTDCVRATSVGENAVVAPISRACLRMATSCWSFFASPNVACVSDICLSNCTPGAINAPSATSPAVAIPSPAALVLRTAAVADCPAR
ncbi:Uncharacterised protein [Serratia marcescens]|nr:Uncharacterised protein [Serratia marcescens]